MCLETSRLGAIAKTSEWKGIAGLLSVRAFEENANNLNDLDKIIMVTLREFECRYKSSDAVDDIANEIKDLLNGSEEERLQLRKQESQQALSLILSDFKLTKVIESLIDRARTFYNLKDFLDRSTKQKTTILCKHNLCNDQLI